MSRVLILFIWIIRCINAEAEQEIALNIVYHEENGVSTAQCQNSDLYVLKEYVTTEVVMNVPWVNKHKCQFDDRKISIGKFTKKNNKSSVATVKSLTSNDIECDFYINKGGNTIQPIFNENGITYTKFKCKFQIKLKLWKKLLFFINGKRLKHRVETNSYEVDAVSYYNFVSKELVDVKCVKPAFGDLSVQISQYNFSTVPSKMIDEISFQMIIDQNFTRIDCIFEKDDIKTVHRLYMIEEKYVSDNVIKVNDLAIRNNSSVVNYNYFGHIPEVYCPGTTEEGVCDIKGIKSTINLVKDVPKNGIYIDGLSDYKIRLQHYYDSYHSRLIHYEYYENEIIHVTGSYGSDHGDVVWEFDGCINNTSTFESSMKEEHHLKSVTFKPKNGDKMLTTIKFIYIGPKEEIEDISTNAGVGEATNSSLWSNCTDKYSDDPAFDVIGFLKVHLREVLGGALVVIFVVLLICLMVVLKKRSKSAIRGNDTDVDYVNLDHNSPDAQFPKLNESKYLQPPQETGEYSIPVDVNADTSLYSVPFKPNIEDMYAKPIPKNKRGNPDVTYAELGFKNAENPYSEVKPKQQSIYAEVHHVRDETYANVDRKDYENDFRNTLYANSKDEESVEPAYCQIGALRK